MSLIAVRLSKVVDIAKKLNLNYLISTNRSTIKYLFADLYAPPPEEVGIRGILLDVKSSVFEVYVSALDYSRVYRTYSEVKNLEIIPVSRLNVDVGRPLIEDLTDYLKKKIGQAKGALIGIDGENLPKFENSIEIGEVVKRIRRIKTEEEIETIRRAVELTELIIKKVAESIRPSMTESEIAGLLELEARKMGVSGHAFNPIVAVGANMSFPHHIPSSTRFEGAQPVLIDYGVRLNGYVADITRMLIPRSLESKYSEIVKHVDIILGAINTAVNRISLGVKADQVEKEVRDYMKDLSKYFIHGLGHGIGVDVHEDPSINMQSQYEFENGVTFTIEPGIYVHTAYGVRIEHDYALRDGRPVKLSEGEGVIELQ